jgi:glycosyltransferase involved in cell wall biosynthesis
METRRLSGPAKNLIGFARRAAQPNGSAFRVAISVATFHRGNTPPDNEFTIACQKVGLRVHAIHERFALDPAIVPAIRRLIANESPDIVQTHSVKSHFLVRLSGAYKQRPWIAFHHGYTWTDLKVLFYNQLDRWSLRASSRVVAVCQPFASALERGGIPRERITIQHNSVTRFLPAAIDTVTRLRQDLRIPNGVPVLVNVARLSREKGQADLIKAVAVLKKENSQFQLRLVLVGAGPDRARLERLATKWGAADRITFVGHQSDVAPYYSLADLMVLPSCTEGSPNTLLEAMAAGLPIVATAVGGVPEIASAHEAALLVPPQDPVALASAISEVLNTESLRARLSAAARNAVSAYSPEAYCDSMLSLYRDRLAGQLDLQRDGGSQHSQSSATRVPEKTSVAD